jgi:hypothetical protein
MRGINHGAIPRLGHAASDFLDGEEYGLRTLTVSRTEEDLMAVKTWFITGTSRGFGREWAIAALDRGDQVAATARDIASLRVPAGHLEGMAARGRRRSGQRKVKSDAPLPVPAGGAALPCRWGPVVALGPSRTRSAA